MSLETIVSIFVTLIFIFSVIVFFAVGYELVTGRYKRFKKLQDDFSELEERQKQRRKKIEGNNHE